MARKPNSQDRRNQIKMETTLKQYRALVENDETQKRHTILDEVNRLERLLREDELIETVRLEEHQEKVKTCLMETFHRLDTIELFVDRYKSNVRAMESKLRDFEHEHS